MIWKRGRADLPRFLNIGGINLNWKNEREFDRALGINTSLTDTDWSKRRQNPCQPTPIAALEAVAARLCPGEQVADCGCGTGRAVFYLADAGFRVTGVELDGRRFADAAENLRRCERKQPDTAARIRLVQGAAQDFDFADVDAVYCFNPFPAAVLRGVLKRIGRAGRPVRMFCYYPDDEWTEVLYQTGWILTETIDLTAQLGSDPRERIDIWKNTEE